MPTQLFAAAAELILMINCFAICLELLVVKRLAPRVAALGLLTVGIAACLGALRYTGSDVVAYHIWMSEIASYFGIVAYFTVLAGTIKRDDFPLYLLLLVSMLGYTLQISWLKDVAIIAAFVIQGLSLYRNKVPAYHFATAFIAILGAGALALTGMQSAGLSESFFHLLLAVAIHQYFRQYSQRP